MLIEEDLRMKVDPASVLPYSSAQPSSLLPLFLSLLVMGFGVFFFLLASTTYWHFKNSGMYSMVGSSSLGLLVNIKKILHSQSLLPRKLRDRSFFCLLGVRPGHKLLAEQG